MKQEGLKERVELLEIGEKLGYPRLGYGRSTKIPHDKRIPQGQDGWEKFCAHAHVRRILPALRIGRVLRDNNVMVFHPLSGREVAVTQPITVTIQDVEVHPDLLDEVPDLPPAPLVTPSVPPRRKRGGHKRQAAASSK